MWAHYADNHSGIVLIFGPRKNSMLGSSKKLKYVKTRPTMTVDNVIETLYTKAKAWAYEAEYRILKKKGDDCYAFDQEALTGVILGMKMTEEIKQRVINVIHRCNHKISLYQAYSDASTYRIMRRPVDLASSANA